MPRISSAFDIVQVSDPATPVAGRQFLYFKSDGLLYSKNAAGVVAQVGSGGASTTVVTSVTAAHTAVAGSVVLANGTFAVTLPAVASGAQVTIKNIGTGTITVTRDGVVLIDGATTAVLNIQDSAITVVSDGVGWWIT